MRTESSTKRGCRCACSTTNSSSGRFSSSKTGALIDCSTTATRPSASSAWALPTRSVPRPRWLCVASGTSSKIRVTSPSTNPASSRRSVARSRTRPCAHGQALIPVASTPTTRRTRSPAAAAIPISDTISCVGRPLTGVSRRSGQRAAMCTSARSASCRSTMCRAMCSASTSIRSPSPRTSASIASSKSSGKRDMCTPFWSRPRSTVQSISAAISISWSPRRMRIAFCTRVTPARESASATGGADACMSWVPRSSLTSRPYHRPRPPSRRLARAPDRTRGDAASRRRRVPGRPRGTRRPIPSRRPRRGTARARSCTR